MPFLRLSFVRLALLSSATVLLACAGADNTATLAGDGEGTAGEGGAGGAAGTTSTKPVGGKGGASGKGGSSGKGGNAGEAGTAGEAGQAGAGGKAGTGGKGGAAGKAGTGGQAGSGGKGGSGGKAGTAGASGASGKAGESGSAGAAGSGPVGCDPNDEGATYDANRTLAERADEECEESLEGISSGPGDVDWFSYHGIDNPNLFGIGCNTKPYARFVPNEAAKEICIYVVQDGLGAEPTCAKGTPSTDGPAGGPFGEVYGCCDPQEVQLDYNEGIFTDNATIYLRVTGSDDADCRPYKITHAYGE